MDQNMIQNGRLEKKEDFFQGKQLLNTKLLQNIRELTMTKKILFLLFSLTIYSSGMSGFCADQIPDISKFKDLTTANESQCVYSENFDKKLNTKAWGIPKTCAQKFGEGIDGSGAMFLERKAKDKNHYHSAVVKYLKLKLVKGQYYRFTVWYRTKDVNKKASINALPRLYPDRNDDLVAFFPRPYPKVTEKWTKTQFEFRAGGNDVIELTLFLRVVGKLWYDKLKIEKISGHDGTVYPIRPYRLQLGNNNQITFKAFKWVTAPDKLRNCAVVAKIGEHVAMGAVDSKGNAKVAFKDLPFGKQQVEAYFVNLKDKTIIAKDKFAVFKYKEIPKVAGDATIDKYGRVIVDGKPFLPIGIYVAWVETEEQVKRIADGGFNFIGNYTSARLNIAKGKGDIPYRKRVYMDNVQRCAGQFKENFETEKGKKQIRASLDMLQSYNLKFMPIYTFGGITSPVFNHPTVFARYTADERPSDQVPLFRKDREKIAEIDPNHLVVALTNKHREAIPYAKAADVLGLDIYPFESRGVKSIRKSQREFLLKSLIAGIPIMFVPQAFNVGAFSPDQPAENFPFPTFEQMRTQVLNAAIFNVKWFCFYSFGGIWYLGEQYYPGSPAKFWPEVVKVSKLLKELSPWLLSIERAPRLMVGRQSSKESIVDAKAFTVKGKTCVLISATGPGKIISRIKVPGCPNLKSKYGRTKNLGRGNYLFTGEDVSSDVLMP